MKSTMPDSLAGAIAFAFVLTLSLPQGALARTTENGPTPSGHTYVNARVLTYAQNHLGQQVGDGACFALGDSAVAAAGGKRTSELGPTGPDAAYVWGDLITTLTPSGGSPAGVQPGDIIQFRNVELATEVKTVQPDGSWYTTTSTQSMPHHTAVVAHVRGNLIDVLHQNIKGIRTVQKGTIWAKSYTQTQTVAGGVKVTTTYRYSGGTMWIYRPYS
jgi:hypothetical protein